MNVQGAAVKKGGIQRHSKKEKRKYKKEKKWREKFQHASTQTVTEVARAAKKSKQSPTLLPAVMTRGRSMVSLSLSFLTPSCHLIPTLPQWTSLRPKDPGNISSEVPIINRSLLDASGLVNLGEGSFGKITLQMYNGNLPVAVKEYKANDLYKINSEAGKIYQLQKCPQSISPVTAWDKHRDETIFDGHSVLRQTQ